MLNQALKQQEKQRIEAENRLASTLSSTNTETESNRARLDIERAALKKDKLSFINEKQQHDSALAKQQAELRTAAAEREAARKVEHDTMLHELQSARELLQQQQTELQQQQTALRSALEAEKSKALGERETAEAALLRCVTFCIDVAVIIVTTVAADLLCCVAVLCAES